MVFLCEHIIVGNFRSGCLEPVSRSHAKQECDDHNDFNAGLSEDLTGNKLDEMQMRQRESDNLLRMTQIWKTPVALVRTLPLRREKERCQIAEILLLLFKPDAVLRTN